MDIYQFIELLKKLDISSPDYDAQDEIIIKEFTKNNVLQTAYSDAHYFLSSIVKSIAAEYRDKEFMSICNDEIFVILEEDPFITLVDNTGKMLYSTNYENFMFKLRLFHTSETYEEIREWFVWETILNIITERKKFLTVALKQMEKEKRKEKQTNDKKLKDKEQSKSHEEAHDISDIETNDTKTPPAEPVDFKLQDPNRMLNASEAAKLLKISKSTLYLHTHKKTIPFYKPKGTSRLLFKESELIEYMQSGRKKTEQEIINEAQLKAHNTRKYNKKG